MGLRLIYGSAGCGKSRFCIDSIKERLEKGENKHLILIVPEQFSFQAEKSLVEHIRGTGIGNAEVTSFERIAYSVFDEVGGITKKHMNSSGKLMLVSNIMNKLKEELKVFAAASEQKGFVNKISDIITEFKRYDISPYILKEALGNIQEGELFRDKIYDISIIFETFEEALHRNYIDSEDELNLLYDKIEYWSLLEEAEIWFDEFNSFTTQQYKIIEKMLKKAERVNITLCINTSGEMDLTDVFAPIKNTEKKLIDLANENAIQIEDKIVLKSSCMDRFKENQEIKHLEANYFRHPNVIYSEKTEDLSIIRGLNPYAEIEAVARDIIKFTRQEEVRFKEIAVITRDLSIYEKIIKVIFDEYKIPYFIDKKKQIDDNPLVVLITSAIDIFNKNWSYEAMFRYLKAGLLNIKPDDLHIIENYVMANGIRGKNKWNSQWENGNEELLEKVNKIRVHITTPLLKLNESLKENKKAEEICKAIFNFLCDLGVNETIESWVNKFNEEGNQALAREYSQIWNLVMELLDQIVEVFKEEPLNLKEFVKLLSLGFGEHKMGIIPPSLDEVLVSDVERVRTNTVKLLYVIGVNDGIFPAVLKDEGILTDADRNSLRNMDVEIADDSKIKTFEEQFLIYKTLTNTGKYLRLCYSIADFEGKALRPSIIISRLKVVFPRITEEGEIIEKDIDSSMELVTREIPTFNKLVSLLRRDNKDEEISPFWRAVEQWYKDNPEWRSKLDAIYSASAYTNAVEQISKEKVRKLYGDKLYFSVSKLEKYVECPFAYYVQYGLKAKERKVFAISVPDLGSFMHSVIDEFSKIIERNSMKWYEIDETWCIKTVSDIVDKEAKEVSGGIFDSSPRYRYFTERLKRVLIRTILIIIEHLKRSGFQPIGYEVGFDNKAVYPPIEIELSNGEKVKLIGRIDRVDKLTLEGKDYYRIIDYKSGNKDFKLSDVYYGLQIQLLTYLDAILTNEQIKDKDPKIPGGVFYLRIHDPIVKGSREISEEEIEKEIMKELKMRGLLLADPKIVKEMDKEIEGSSLIIPARINKGGDLGKSSVGTEEQFNILREHVKNNLIKTCEEMLRGEINIRPFKDKDKTACSFCMYSAICQFDNAFDGNSYKVIEERKDEEIWQLLSMKK
ncbi:helicase-exonuclease AddAB subunit AddB [Clostridium homopropionicum]|nr:helicase-exonuclease AddAB subunit AddB [Clostridium homopropionicum]